MGSSNKQDTTIKLGKVKMYQILCPSSNTLGLIQMLAINICWLASLNVAPITHAATNETASGLRPEKGENAATLSISLSHPNTSLHFIPIQSELKREILLHSNKTEIITPTALPAKTTATTGGYSTPSHLSTTFTPMATNKENDLKIVVSDLVLESENSINNDRADTMISSIVTSSDKRYDNHSYSASIRLQEQQQKQTICDTDSETGPNCSTIIDKKSEGRDTANNIHVETDVRWPDEDLNDNSNNRDDKTSLHYSNSRLVLRLLVVGLFCLLSLSLMTVYTIKFFFCRRKERTQNITLSLSRRPSSFIGRNLVMDFDQFERNHQSSLRSCSCFTELPQATVTPQLNLLQTLFRPDSWARYRVSDTKIVEFNNINSFPNHCNNIGSHVENNYNSMLAHTIPVTSATSSQYSTNSDQLHHYDCQNSSTNLLLPFLTSRPCCSTRESNQHQIANLQIDTQPTIETTSNINPGLPMQQLNYPPRPPTYSELFASTSGHSKPRESLPTGEFDQNQSNSDDSTSTSFRTESPVATRRDSMISPQKDHKNLLVRFNLNKTKLLSAGDLMVLSRLIDVPIVVQQQSHNQHEHSTQR